MTHDETDHRRDADPEHPIVLDAKRARAGRPGVPILYVLLWGIALVVIAFVIIWFIFYMRVR